MGDTVLWKIKEMLNGYAFKNSEFTLVNNNGGNGNLTVGGDAVPSGKKWIVPIGSLRVTGSTSESIDAWFQLTWKGVSAAVSPSIETISTDGSSSVRKIGIPRMLILPETARLDGAAATIDANNALVLEYMYLEVADDDIIGANFV